jgi:competence protein ComEC
MSELAIANLFFVLSFAFILGIIFPYFSQYWFIFNFILAFLFYLKFRNFKISFLFLLFLFAGSFYYFLRQEIVLPKIEIPEIFRNYRNFLELKIENSLPFSEENLLRGIFFGSKFEDKNLKEIFINSGLIHLTAVSGQNLTLMFSIFYEALKNFSFLTPNFLFYLSSFLIIFFIFIMGFEGNVLRAALMAFLLILVKNKFGRLPLKRNILIFTLLIFVLINPFSIIKDIGTQLSFLAITGIFYLAPLIEKRLNFLKIEFLRKTISETFAAQILTLPAILYYFGNFNLFSFIANILVLPLVPYLMSLAGIFLILPFKYLIWLSFPFLKYIIFVAITFSHFVFYLKIPLIFTFVFYIFIFLEIYSRLKNEIIDFKLDFD